MKWHLFRIWSFISSQLIELLWVNNLLFVLSIVQSWVQSTVIRMFWYSNHLQISVFVTTKWHDSNHLLLKCDSIWIHSSFSCDLSKAFTNHPAVPLKQIHLVQHLMENAWVELGITLISQPQETPVLGIAFAFYWLKMRFEIAFKSLPWYMGFDMNHLMILNDLICAWGF